MPTISLTRPGAKRRGAGGTPTGQHPTATIKAEGGTTLDLPYAPTGANLGGWAVEWSTVDRPGRQALVLEDGPGVPTLGLDVLLAAPDHQTSVETLIRKIRRIAESGERVTLVNLSPSERGPWRLESVNVTATLRQQGTNHVTRAAVSLGFIAAVDAKPRLGPVSGGKKGGKGGGKGNKKTTHVRATKNTSLRKLAVDAYGEPDEWKRIARANGITDPNNIKPGTRLTIPPDDKKD